MSVMTRQTLKVRVAAPETKVVLDASSAEHGSAVATELARVFGADKVLVGNVGKKVEMTVPWNRISEFWALVHEVSRRWDFVVNYSD